MDVAPAARPERIIECRDAELVGVSPRRCRDINHSGTKHLNG